MSKRPPKWQRSGYRSDSEYRAACAATRHTRKASKLASASKLTHRHILDAMWNRAEFDKPEVTVTRENLISDVGCSFDTVREAWRFLKKEGSIKPVHNRLGGRGNAVTFRLCVAGSQDSPSDVQTAEMKAKRDREAAWRYLSGKYGPQKALRILDGEEG